MNLRLHDIQAGVTTLGPGTRFAVWTQGCLRSCLGCMSPQTRDIQGGYEETTEHLAQVIVASGADGLTISGGEPFLQAAALAELIGEIRRQKDMGVILYTGCTYAELLARHDPTADRLLACCDLLIDGAYVDALNDGKALRGSSNQQAIFLTERYRALEEVFGKASANIEFFFKDDGFSMIGIPSREQLEQVKQLSF